MTREEIINDSDKAMSINGVPGRLTHRTIDPSRPKRWCRQRWVSEQRKVLGWGPGAYIVAELRFDDDCQNGHETFAMTATIQKPRARHCEACGCLHEEMARYFPELAPLIKWHLVSTDGPMHYLANTVYHAGDRDHNGLRAGESKPVRCNGGGNLWKLVAVNAPGVLISTTPTGDEYKEKASLPLFILENCKRSETVPGVVPTLRWEVDMVEGKGKARELEHARSSAVWPEATDAELSVEPGELRKALEARLPKLLADFRADIEAAGFIWEVPSDE